MPPCKQIDLDEKRRKDIIEGARDVFIKKGFHATSMSDIAKQAGLSTSHLYNFYENKAAIVMAVEQEMADEVTKILSSFAETDLSDKIDPPACLEKFFDENRSSWFLMVLTEALRNENLLNQLQRSDEKISVLRMERCGMSKDDQDAQVRHELSLCLFLGFAIRKIFFPKVPEEVMKERLLALNRFIMKGRY